VPEIPGTTITRKTSPYKAFSPSALLNSPTLKPEEPIFITAGF